MSRKLPNVTTQDLENILGTENWKDSEDGLDFPEDDDVADPTYNLEPNEHESSYEDLEEPLNLENVVQSRSTLVIISINAQNITTATVPNLASSSTSTTSTASPWTANRVPRTNIIWKMKSLNLNDDQLRFHGSDILPPDILCLDTPFEVFSYLFTENIVNLIRDQANLYSIQKDANKPVNATSQEIRQFVGIVYYMSIVRMPNVKMYWSEKISFAPVRETMPSKRSELLRQLLHFNDNSKMLPYDHVDSDRLYKIRPLKTFTFL